MKLSKSISLFFLCLMLAAALHVLSLAAGRGLYDSNCPIGRILEASRSLALRGTLQAEEFRLDMEKARELSRLKGGAVWTDVAAITTEGKYVPKHAPLTAITAAPFYLIFGENGFRIFSVLSLALLFYLAATLCFKSPVSLYNCLLTIAALSVLNLTLIPLGLSFSYDIQLCLLLLLSLKLQSKQSALSGLPLGLSIFIRPSAILFSLPLFCSALLGRERKTQVILFLSFALPLAAYALLMRYWFGSYLTTPYSHIPLFEAGNLRLQTHPMGFNFVELGSDLLSKLFDSTEGLGLSSLGFFFVLPHCIKYYSQLSSQDKACALTLLLATIHSFSYEYWRGAGLSRLLLPFCLIASVAVFKTFTLGLKTQETQEEQKD